MAEYLRALEPVLSHQQFERTKAIVKQFSSPPGLGPTLHQYLVEKRDAEDNWVILFGVRHVAQLPTTIHNEKILIIMRFASSRIDNKTHGIFFFFFWFAFIYLSFLFYIISFGASSISNCKIIATSFVLDHQLYEFHFLLLVVAVVLRLAPWSLRQHLLGIW